MKFLGLAPHKGKTVYYHIEMICELLQQYMWAYDPRNVMAITKQAGPEDQRITVYDIFCVVYCDIGVLVCGEVCETQHGESKR